MYSQENYIMASTEKTAFELRMERVFGINWRTTLWGVIAAISTGVTTQPQLVSFLTPEHAAWVRGFCGLLAFIATTLFAVFAKDSRVTGGQVPSTPESEKRVSNGTGDGDKK